MPRPIPTLLAELQSTIAELAEAMSPIQKLVGAFKAMDIDTPLPRAAKAPSKRRRQRRTAMRASAPVVGSAAKPSRKPAKKSSTAAARLALQGRYMSALRKLSKADQAEVKKVRADQGFEAAIRAADELKR